MSPDLPPAPGMGAVDGVQAAAMPADAPLSAPTKPTSDTTAPPTPAAASTSASKPSKKKAVTKAPRKISGVDREMKEYIVENLGMLLATGVTVSESLESIASELPNKAAHKAILQMRDSIDDGMTFSAAIKQTGLYSNSVVTLIEVGESSGRLPENLRVIAEQMHKSNVMASKIKSAMLYPAFLVSLLFIVGTGVGVFLLPKLLGIITGLNVKVGFTTRIMIVLGTFMGKYGVFLALGVVLLVIFLAILVRTFKPARYAGEALLYRIPGFKRLLFETEISRFGFILGTLLDTGLPVVVALQSLSDSMTTHRYREFALQLCHSIEEGNTFAQSLAAPQHKKLLPGTIRQLVTSAEKSGNLSGSLIKVGTIYEDKADITARNLETLLEPVILVILAVAVLFVALSVILPIYSLVGGIT